MKMAVLIVLSILIGLLGTASDTNQVIFRGNGHETNKQTIGFSQNATSTDTSIAIRANNTALEYWPAANLTDVKSFRNGSEVVVRRHWYPCIVLRVQINDITTPAITTATTPVPPPKEKETTSATSTTLLSTHLTQATTRHITSATGKMSSTEYPTTKVTNATAPPPPLSEHSTANITTPATATNLTQASTGSTSVMTGTTGKSTGTTTITTTTTPAAPTLPPATPRPTATTTTITTTIPTKPTTAVPSSTTSLSPPTIGPSTTTTTTSTTTIPPTAKPTTTTTSPPVPSSSTTPPAIASSTTTTMPVHSSATASTTATTTTPPPIILIPTTTTTRKTTTTMPVHSLATSSTTATTTTPPPIILIPTTSTTTRKNIPATSTTTTTTTTQKTTTTTKPVTTNLPPTQPPSIYEQIVFLTFKLDMIFWAELYNVSSAAFKTLAIEIEFQINRVLIIQFPVNYKRCIVNSFAPGSIKVNSTLVFSNDTLTNNTEIQEKLIEAWESHNITLPFMNGTLSVDGITQTSNSPQMVFCSAVVIILTTLLHILLFT